MVANEDMALVLRRDDLGRRDIEVVLFVDFGRRESTILTLFLPCAFNVVHHPSARRILYWNLRLDRNLAVFESRF